MATKQKSPLLGGIKVILLLGLMAPAALWIDEKFGPGYLAGIQEKIVPAKTDDITPAKKDDTTPAQTPAKPDEKPDKKPDDKTGEKPEEKPTENDEKNPETAAEKPTSDDDKKPVQKAKAAAPTPNKNLQGIDISHYQGVVDWQVLAKAKLAFVFVKATGGDTYTDPKFHDNWHALRTMAVARGAYHFFYAADDGKSQAENFLKAVGKLKPTDMPPVLDVEITDHTKTEALVEGVLSWLETVEDETGRLPMIYSDVSFANQYLTDDRLAKYPLWIADYSKHVGALPAPWKDSGWTFWQYSQSGHALGIKGMVDLDVFNGDKNKFEVFIKASSPD